MNEQTKRLVTEQQLTAGIHVLWANGRQEQFFYTGVRRVGSGVFEVNDPKPYGEDAFVLLYAAKEFEWPTP